MACAMTIADSKSWAGAQLNVREIAKSIIYRTPIISRLMAPSYPYKVNPGELAAMVGLIDSTRSSGAAVAEIGVAQGDTSVFLLEHLKTVGDGRELLLFDTFSGFTDESISFEVANRRKNAQDYDKFRYGDEARFNRNLAHAGYDRFRTIKGDAARFDWSSLGPIGAVLLDIDLYQPTIAILDAIYPHIVSGGGIVVDDCLADSPWDGSLQAYQEFIAKHDLPFTRAGHKGGLIRKA